MSRLLRLLAIAALAGSLVALPGSGAVAAPTSTASPAATTVDDPLMLVVDVSGSMGDHDSAGTIKIEGAKAGILELLNLLPLNSRIGLRTYPSRGAACGSGQLDIDIAQRDPGTMSASIRALKADGGTPTAEALRAAGADLKAKGYDSATIILVSDGESTCDPPCPVAKELAAQGLHITVRAVGFLIASAGADEMRCLADATGGSYTDVSDAAGLADQLTSLGTARLHVDVTAPRVYNPTIQTSLPVTATITNDSDVAADDVRATLMFDPAAAGGALVTSPVLVLGNAAGGVDLRATWSALPSRAVDTGSLAYTVVVTSRGAPPVVTTGSVRVQDELTLDDAGDMLRSARHVVVLGDSYSSGEGGGDYVATAGKCHRSSHTYALQLWPADRVTDLACSGAVAADYTGHQVNREINGTPWPSQQRQLEALPFDPDLVLLTMGGNDINFADIVKNCLIDLGCSGAHGGPLCSSLPPQAVSACLQNTVGAGPAMWTAQSGSLRTTLSRYYEQVLADVGHAPVVVLPYVEVVPNTTRGALGCAGALPGFGTHEMELIRWLQAELNNQVAAAVGDVRAKGHEGQLFFASDVATALQPDHTLCADEDQRWVQGLLAHVDEQEKVHPTAEGYRAIAGALARWSTHLDPPSVTSSQPQPPGWAARTGRAIVDGIDAGAGWVVDRFRDAGKAVLNSPGLRIVASSPVDVRAGGFLPGASVVVGVGSTMQTLAVVTADENGDVVARVQMPEELRPGDDHVIFAAGFTEGGDYRVQWSAAEVVGPGFLGPLGLSFVGLVLVVLGSLVRVRGRAGPSGAQQPSP